MLRNKPFIFAHLFQDVLMGLIVGSLFSGKNPSDFQTTLGLLFFCMLFLAFSGKSAVV